MKKYIFNFFILLVFVTNTLAQEKYMIYFSDKGSSTKEFLSKESTIQVIAEQTLSKRSIERRKKNLGKDYFTFEDLPLKKLYIEELEKLNIKIVNRLKWFNAVSAYLNDEQFLELKSKYFIKEIKKVKTISSNKKRLRKENYSNKFNNNSKLSTTFDYGFSITQNSLSDIPAVHNLGITGEGVIIGLLDSGFEWKSRVSLQNAKVIAEHDFVFNDTTTANGSFGHGTAVFSILAGFHDGKLIGPSFNSEFVLAKTEFVPTERHVEEDNYAAALEWMDSIGVDITTSSLGYNIFDKVESSYSYEDMDGTTTIVTKAVELAFSKGIVTITSAGNDGDNSWKYIAAPADGKNIISVGSVNSTNIIADYSSRGPTFDGRIKPEVLAQGTSTYHATLAGADSYSSNGSGTSYAAPIVAGIAGLLLSAHPHLTNKQVRNIMLEASDNVETPDTNRGYGLLSAIKAVTYPNLKWNGSKFVLTKMFDKNIKIKDGTLSIKIESSAELSMVKEANNKYTVELPNLENDNIYEFHFNYNDDSNTKYRIPKEKNYKLNYGNLNIDLVLTNTDIDRNEKKPTHYLLSQNYPNPFNPTTTIKYSIPSLEPLHATFQLVQLKVYDLLGREIVTLVNGEKQSGNYIVTFDASEYPSGVYFYRLSTNNFSKTKKMILLR